MTDAGKPSKRRGLDVTGLVLFAALVTFAVGVGAALIYFGYFGAREFALWLLVCGAFLAVGMPAHITTAPKNTLVHGAARTATETEAQAAARGAIKAPGLHEQHFPD